MKNNKFKFENILKTIKEQEKQRAEKFKPVSCSIKESQYKKLEAIAKSCNKGVSAFMKALIEQIIKEYK